MKLSWELISLALLALFVLFAGASQASSIGTFIQERRIDILSQTGILDTNLTYTFKELNDTHWIANFCMNPTTSAVFSPASYPLTSLTGGISFEQVSPIRFDAGTKCGWFYLIFPKGFKDNEQAQFGSGTTVINTATTVPFYPNQRAVCRDGVGNVHVAWRYSTTTIAYANSTDEGATWRLSYTIVNSTGTKDTPSISCDGNNITIAYSNYTGSNYNVVVFNSTNNGATFSTLTPISGTGTFIITYVNVERRSQNIYVVYDVYTSSETCIVGGFWSIKFINSTNAGATWGAVKTVKLGSCGGTGSGWVRDNEAPSLVVNGTGNTNDRLDVGFRGYYDWLSRDIYDVYIMYVNSTNSGANWGAAVTLDTSDMIVAPFDTPSINSLGTNIYVSYSDYSDIHFQNNSNNGIGSWTTTLLDSNTLANNPSVAINNNSQPCVFWQNSSTTTLKTDLFYRAMNSTAWDTQQQMTTDGKNNTYVNTRYNYYSSGIDVLWTNGSTATKSITYSLMNCTVTEAGGAPPAGGAITPEGDSFTCDIPDFWGGVVSMPVLCSAHSNTTGQPVTGATVTCTVHSSPYFASTSQAVQTCTEQGNGMYNCTFLSGNQAANTPYITNCSASVNGVVNWYMGTTYISQTYPTSCASTAEVNAVGENVTSANETCATANENILAVGSNLTNVNSTIVALLNQLGVNLTSVNNTVLLVGINTTSLNVSIFMVGSNLTGHNQTIYDLISLLENLTAQQVWEYPNRDTNCSNCSEGGGITLEELATVNDTVKAGWGYENRTDEIVNAIQNYFNAGLVAKWTFNEGSGSVASDSSPFGNNCTINNTSWISGVQGNALEFNGFDSYLDCGNGSSLNFGTGDFTIMAWVKTTEQAEQSGTIINKMPSKGYYLIIDSNSAYNFFLNGDPNGGGAYNDTLFSQYTWVHLAAVRNGDTAQLYVNGILADGQSLTDVNNIDNIGNLAIGAEDTGEGFLYFFNGTIDEVKMWNETKDTNFIQLIYNSELPTSSGITAQEIWEYAVRTMTDYNQSGVWDNMTYIQDLINSLANTTPEDIWGSEYPERVTNCSNCTGGTAEIDYEALQNYTWNATDRNLTYYEDGGNTYYQNNTLNQTIFSSEETTGDLSFLNFQTFLLILAVSLLIAGVVAQSPATLIASGILFVFLSLTIMTEGISSSITSSAQVSNLTYNEYSQLSNISTARINTFGVWNDIISEGTGIILFLLGGAIMFFATTYMMERRKGSEESE